jgi:hypothetical protein
MKETVKRRVMAAVEQAKEILGEKEPAIVRVTDVADRVAGRLGISQVTAKKYLRIGCDEGELVELEPNSRFYVDLPEATEAGIRDLRIVQQHAYKDGRYAASYLILSTDEEKNPPSSYGPGNTTYLVTTGYVTRLVAQIAAERKAKEEQEKAEREERKKAERAEIRRRNPDLLTTARRLSLILGAADGYDGRVRAWLHEPALSGYKGRPKEPIEEWDLHFDVGSSGGVVPVLMEILDHGLGMYLVGQPKVHCVHCGERIMRFERQGGWWWHLNSTNAKCKDADTKAMPPEGERNPEA